MHTDELVKNIRVNLRKSASEIYFINLAYFWASRLDLTAAKPQ